MAGAFRSHPIRPLANRVLVRRQAADSVTSGGVYVPESAQERSQKGVVLAVGPGRHHLDGLLVPVGVEEGDTVLFERHAGTAVPGEDELVILREEELLAVVG